MDRYVFISFDFEKDYEKMAKIALKLEQNDYSSTYINVHMYDLILKKVCYEINFQAYYTWI